MRPQLSRQLWTRAALVGGLPEEPETASDEMFDYRGASMILKSG